jgi:hypothetical protein
MLLQAMHESMIQQAGIKLLIAGEFYEDRAKYDNIIQELSLQSQLY